MLWRFIKIKKVFSSLILSICCIFLIYFKYIYKEPISIFPNFNSYDVRFFTDSCDTGNSYFTRKIVTDTSIEVDCVLKDGFEYPFIGLDLVPKNGIFMDMSEYSEIELETSCNVIDHLHVFLTLDDSNVIDKNHKHGQRRVQTDFGATENKVVYKLPLEIFESPNWWYTSIKQSKKEFSNPDYSKIFRFSVSSSVNPPINKPFTINVFSIRFTKPTLHILCIILTIWVLVFSIWYLLYLKQVKLERTKLSEIKTVKIDYSPIIINESESEIKKPIFLEYISKHYSDPELTLVTVSKEVGVNQRLISDTISEQFNCNFKTYINQIRIQEAKRLLLTTNLNISEIGYKVGFNSPTNFNRVFKNLTNMSPSEYLESIGK